MHLLWRLSARVLKGAGPCFLRSEWSIPRMNCRNSVAQTRSMSSQLDVSGIYPPIATPFNPDESIAYDKLSENIQKWNKIPFTGYVVQGSNGEYAYLTADERVDMVKRVAEMAGPEKLIIAGAGCESTRDTIAMTKKMADAGAKAVLIVTPCFYKGSMTSDALTAHFTKVANDSPVPVILYNVPANTGIDIAPEVVLKLAEHPNIIGLKDSGGDISRLGFLCFKTKGTEFQILAGSASFLYPAYAVGCVGGVCALANVLGQELCDLETLIKQGKTEEAKLLQQRLVGPNVCVTRRYGVPGLKQAMEWFGYNGGPTRSPLLPLTEAEINTMQQVFRDSGFLS